MTRTLPLLVVALVACVADVACGGRPAVSLDAGVDLTQGDAALDGSLAPDLPVTDATRPDTLQLPVEGLVYLVENYDAQLGAQQGAAYAFFTPQPMPFFSRIKDLGSGCATFPLDEVGKLQFSAGTITVTGGPYKVTLKPEKKTKPDDWLYPAWLYPDLFSAGTKIAVSATGGQVPAFNGLLRGVGELKASFPAGPLPRGDPLKITFTPATGTIWITIVAYKGTAALRFIRCVGQAGTGSFVVPQAVSKEVPTLADSLRVGAGLFSEVVISPSKRLKIHLIAHHQRYAELKLQ
jgi:hypothetical protein